MGEFSSCWCVCLIHSVYHLVQSLSLERGSHWLNHSCLWSILSPGLFDKPLARPGPACNASAHLVPLPIMEVKHNSCQQLHSYTTYITQLYIHTTIINQINNHLITSVPNLKQKSSIVHGHLWLLSTRICVPGRCCWS